MTVDSGPFRANGPLIGKMPTHGVYNQQEWHLMRAEATPLSLHHGFDSAMAAAVHLEGQGAKCTVVCYDYDDTPMLRILHMEDCKKDRLLIEQEIARHWSDVHIQWVHCGRMFAKTLAESPVNLVLCDNGGPDFDGKNALALTRIIQPGTPFVFVSGAPETHMEALRRSGADGVVSKHQLSQLKKVVEAAFQRRGRVLP